MGTKKKKKRPEKVSTQYSHKISQIPLRIHKLLKTICELYVETFTLQHGKNSAIEVDVTMSSVDNAHSEEVVHFQCNSIMSKHLYLRPLADAFIQSDLQSALGS